MSGRTLKVADELSQIRAQLGEAVIDGTKWRELLESMCRAIGAEGGSLRQFPNRTVDTPSSLDGTSNKNLLSGKMEPS
jgi:hypothetical protein